MRGHNETFQNVPQCPTSRDLLPVPHRILLDSNSLRARHAPLDSLRGTQMRHPWLAHPEEDLPSPPAALPPPQPAVPLARTLEDIFPRLPEVFDKSDVVRLLGWDPPRSSLFRVLQRLTE